MLRANASYRANIKWVNMSGHIRKIKSFSPIIKSLSRLLNSWKHPLFSTIIQKVSRTIEWGTQHTLMFRVHNRGHNLRERDSWLIIVGTNCTTTLPVAPLLGITQQALSTPGRIMIKDTTSKYYITPHIIITRRTPLSIFRTTIPHYSRIPCTSTIIIINEKCLILLFCFTC